MTAVDQERERRLQAWAQIRPLSNAGALDAEAVNQLREDEGGLQIFWGGRGIWTDKTRTSAVAPDGVTVSVLHTGRSYADDLLPDGIVYHASSRRTKGESTDPTERLPARR